VLQCYYKAGDSRLEKFQFLGDIRPIYFWWAKLGRLIISSLYLLVCNRLVAQALERDPVSILDGRIADN
jgi:hypothetical protein